MTLIWTTPRAWETNEPITKEKLNAISDDLTYLMNPSFAMATIRGSGANVTQTVTVPTDIDNAAYLLSVELTGVRPVTIDLFGLLSNNTLSAINRVDIFIDNTTYASSLTGTQVTGGLWEASQYVVGNIIPVSIRHTIPAGTLAAGVHTFQPRYWSSAGALTWYELNLYSQFKVGEYQ